MGTENASAAGVVTSAQELQRSGARAALRQLALSALAAGYAASGRFSALSRGDRVQILNFHHLFPDEEDAFRRLLERLQRDFRLVSYSEAVDRVFENRFDGPILAVSFDDGLASCGRAAEILAEHGASACFFVCPGIVGETDPNRIREFCSRMKLPRVEFLSWDDLEQLLAAGHEVGSHTMTHPNLAKCSRDELDFELGRSFELLQQRLGSVQHFAWPFGRFEHFSAQAAEAVFRAGYRSCASGVRGCHGASRGDDSRPLCLRRDTLVPRDPLGRSLYFLSRSARHPVAPADVCPDAWRGSVAGLATTGNAA